MEIKKEKDFDNNIFDKFESLVLNNKENKYEFNGEKLENASYFRMEFDAGVWTLELEQKGDSNNRIKKKYLHGGIAVSNDTAIKIKE